MKIAIIGSGVSGLTSAYLLSKAHDVTVYEKDSRIGGHAHTVIVKEKDKKIPVDNGFMVFNPKQYPNFIKLIEELNVEYRDTNMSLGVSIKNGILYKGDAVKRLNIIKLNKISIRNAKFLLDIVRFRILAKRELKNPKSDSRTMAEFLSKHRLGKDLADWFIYPMLSAIWSIKDSDKASDFPVLSTFRFLDNHRLLSNLQPQWKTINGGSVVYVDRLRDKILQKGSKIKTNQNISKIERRNDSAHITVDSKTEKFDYVVFATHADVTKKLIADITTFEKKALNRFSYTNNQTVLHKNTDVVPKNKKMIAAWNYKKVDMKDHAIFTYCMNILQHIPAAYPVYVTLNPQIEIKKSDTYLTESYSHPRYDENTLIGQAEIEKLQGKNNTFFTGAHLGYGFHEDGVASAVNVANKLGIQAPWQE